MILGIEASHAAKPQRTGVEEVCRQVILALQKIVPPEVRVVLYSHVPSGDLFGQLPPNWQEKVLLWRPKKLWSQIRLARELRKNPPDIFFAPGQLLPFFLPRSLQTAVYLHDSAFKVVPKTYKFWGRQYLKLMNRWIVRRANLIITSTEFNKAELKKYYGARAAQKTQIAPLAYDRERYHSNVPVFSPIELEQKFKITKPYLIYVGRIEDKKNAATIVEAFDAARVKLDFQLVLAGKPGYGYVEHIKPKIESSPFKQDIKELGWTASEDLPRLLRSARALVFPSRYEGFGLPVLESMAVGTPVIVSGIPALREVGGGAASYVESQNSADLAQKMAESLVDSPARVSQINLGLERIKLFSWETTARAVYAALSSCQK